MNLAKYIRLSRTLQRQQPVELPDYLPTYARLMRLFDDWHSFPNLVVVYSLQRSHEIVVIDGERHLIYDQYLGQTFEMLNRIWMNSESFHDGEMYAFRLLAEHYAISGEAVLATVCAGSHAMMLIKGGSYASERDLSRHRYLTWCQEAFALAHEVAHVVLIDLPKYLGNQANYEWKQMPFSLFLRSLAKRLGIADFDFRDLDSEVVPDDSRLLFGTTARARFECKCDLLGALFTIATQIPTRFAQVSDTLVAIAIAVRHLRVIGFVRHVASGDHKFDAVLGEYIFRTNSMRRMLNKVAQATACISRYAEDVVEAADRYERLIDDPILLAIKSKFREQKVIEELGGIHNEMSRGKLLRLIGDLTQSGTWE